jgi:hypothetical protein
MPFKTALMIIAFSPEAHMTLNGQMKALNPNGITPKMLLVAAFF